MAKLKERSMIMISVICIYILFKLFWPRRQEVGDDCSLPFNLDLHTYFYNKFLV